MAGPDIKTIDPPADSVPGKVTPAPEPDTKSLDALLDSLNGSAERFQTLWFSFLGLTLYLAIAALATTHRDLLLREAQVLPLVNIKVQLLPFYIIAPLLYWVFHFYLLMMLVLLARTAAEFERELQNTLSNDDDRERYRARVENALFLQLLVGMRDERSGVNSLLLATIALITIVLAPVATLILMQMMFLPYHHLRITWWHRVIVVADFFLIVVMTYRCFFPRGFRKAPLVLGALSRKPRWATAMAFCGLLAVALAPLTYWLSFQQGRWAGEPRPSSFTEWAQWMAGKLSPAPERLPDYVATEGGVVFGLFPDRLKLPSEPIVGEERLERTKKEIASRGGDFVPTLKLDDRDLQAADLSGADLRDVSLNGAAMQDANLSDARLDGARLGCERHGGSWACAQLQGANLVSAQLQGADLGGPQLQGADLRFAGLQGADLSGAGLEGAALSNASLQGADLGLAQLQGADLSGAQLQGADLRGVQLQGADLFGAQLQGADLSGTDLTDSEFNRTFVFRANVARADLSTAAIRSVETYLYKLSEVSLVGQVHALSQPDVDAWIAAATQFAPDKDKADIAARFDRFKPKARTDEQDAADRLKWKTSEETYHSRDPRGAEHRRRLAAFLGALACRADGAPYIAPGLIRNHRLDALGDQLAALRARLEEGRKTPEKCPGVAGLTENDWRALEAIKPD